jgi:glycosyltransferase involved in cell wall biosynthesis
VKLLIVNNEFPPVGGGAGRTSYYLARELTKLGVEVSVLTSISARSLDLPELPGVKVYRVRSWRKSLHEAGKRGMGVFVLLGLARFAALLLTHKYDLIYYFSSIPAGLLSVIAPRHPSIVGLRGLDVPGRDSDSFSLIHTLLKPINLRTWRWADAITASSVNLAESARRYTPDLSFHVVYNGIDTDVFYPAPPRATYQPFRIVAVSRLIKLKGFQYLIEAMREFRPDEAQLTIIGHGSYEAELRALADTHSLNDRVTFAGFQDHTLLPESLRQSDMFALPSYGDSYASAFLEAMACGVPVVGADCGGARELIRHGENGWLVPPHSVPALVEAIRTLKADDALRLRLRQAALEDIERDHSWEAYARRTLELCQSVLQRRKAERLPV